MSYFTVHPLAYGDRRAIGQRDRGVFWQSPQNALQQSGVFLQPVFNCLMNRQLFLIPYLMAAWVPNPTIAQASDPTVDPTVQSCQTYARELYREVKEIRQIQLVDDIKTRRDRFENKVGSQFISTEVMGNGRLMTQKGWQNFSYLCLLESESKALYFRILSRPTYEKGAAPATPIRKKIR
jgi:hypothetical protein